MTRGHLERGVDSLTDEFAGVFSRETIERYVDESLESLSGARLAEFVPLFVHRFARERLRALAQVEGKLTKDVPEVLFVCVQNAGRSQMAAALMDLYAEGRVHVRSAGSDPAEEINPAAVEAMAELGADLEKEFPKPLNDEFVARGRRRDHDGLRRRMPDLPRQALRGLGAGGPGGQGPRDGARNPRRDRGAGAAASRRDRPRAASPRAAPA